MAVGEREVFLSALMVTGLASDASEMLMALESESFESVMQAMEAAVKEMRSVGDRYLDAELNPMKYA